MPPINIHNDVKYVHIKMVTICMLNHRLTSFMVNFNALLVI